ncbi:hypothetical protein HY948_02195 [Candidatus Gottesmanbacteria bacterium]|nr:hypothetical protein [Candidatus Gottesmanbacteria bacterium]
METAAGAFAHEMGVGDTKEAGEALGKAAASSLQQFLAQGAPASENPQEKPFSQRAAETVETAKAIGAELAKWGTIFAAAAGVNTHKQKGAGASAHSEASAAESSSAPKQLSGEILEGEFKEL